MPMPSPGSQAILCLAMKAPRSKPFNRGSSLFAGGSLCWKSKGVKRETCLVKNV
jgi:hypothetical protein